MNKKLIFRVIAAIVAFIGLTMAFYFSKELTWKIMGVVGVWATCVLAFEFADILYDKYLIKKLSKLTKNYVPLEPKEDKTEEIERIDIPKLVLIVGESMNKNRQHMNDMIRDLQYAGVPVTYYHYQQNKFIFTTDRAQVRFVSVNDPYSYKGMRADEIFGCLPDADKLYMRSKCNIDKPLYDGEPIDYLLELHGVVR